MQIASLKNTSNDGFELLFAIDVTYISHLHAPLARSITDHTPLLHKSKPSAKYWIAHQERVVDLSGHDHQLKNFLDALENEGLRGSIYSVPTMEDTSRLKGMAEGRDVVK
ncbi:hypothetical protein IV203_031132 [Nitzschia inconspicua]|uniref:Uncharacterized protein n=1 Tax=Nitzschia inconspicua TaxID=303405 RepID=A0A9K3LTP2_9STRA|nr:hypothetical protein IV203_031132 [Nitzschia inconspicua]